MEYNFPAVGRQSVYLTGHDEVHSLSKNIDANTVRFWMGFSDLYINVFNVLTKLGLTSEFPVKTAEGVEVVPLKVLRAVLPDPISLAPNMAAALILPPFSTCRMIFSRTTIPLSTTMPEAMAKAIMETTFMV